MSHQQNSTSGRPNFHIVTRRPSQAETIAPEQNAAAGARVFKTRWWKLLERLSLILGLTGFSITSLIAGVEKYLDTMRTLETLQAKIVQLEERLGNLEKANARLENELNFIKGRLERPAAETRLSRANDLARIESSARNLPHAVLSRSSELAREQTAPSRDARAPMHVIDKLNMTISYAYRKARSANPDLAGRLSVRCKMDEEGNLSDSEVVALDAEVEEVAASVRDKVRRWNFPETVTGLEEGNFQKTYFLTPSGF
jgi:cell division protein FtsB